jgi:protein involved in polysaccharide export with SLBB domain
MRTIGVFVTLALTVPGCGEILRTPDVAIGASQVIGEQVAYEITALKVTPEVVVRANSMPFLQQVTVDGAGQGAARRVSAVEAIGKRMPGLGPTPDYFIGGGDVIRLTRTINVVGAAGLEAEQNLADNLRVDGQGYIDTTDFGRVLVAGKSIVQAQEAISAAYVARSANVGSSVSEVEFPSGGGGEYSIGPGDVLSLTFILSSVNLDGGSAKSVASSASVVGPDGVATFLQVGAVDVGGLTLSQAQLTLSEAALRGDAATDEVQLNVTKFVSQNIIVTGDVPTSVVTLAPNANTYDNLLASAGVPSTPLSDSLVTLERAGVTYKMRASSILSSNNRGRFVARDGDRIDVRRLSTTPSFRVSVSAFNAHKVTFLDIGTGSPAVLPLTDEALDLRTLLLSRGVKVSRDLDAKVRLVRGGLEYQASASELMILNPSLKVWLKSGDNVVVEPLEYVPSQAVIVGQVGAPQPFPIDQAARSTVSQALFSGGLFRTPSADFKHIYVLRQREGKQYDAYHFDLSEVLNIGLSDRMELRPGDVIFVRTNPIVKFSAMIDILLGLDRRITDVGNRL